MAGPSITPLELNRERIDIIESPNLATTHVYQLVPHLTMSKDSSHTYIHLTQPRFADLFEEFNRPPHLPNELIYVPPQHQPPNPEDEDDVVPDQHAAFGITRATQAKREAVWKDLGMEELMKRGPVKEGPAVTFKGGSKLPR